LHPFCPPSNCNKPTSYCLPFPCSLITIF
jgi:hypothetical protein